MDIVVEKRDKRTEPFSFDKLVTSILKAGVPSGDAEVIAARVKNWVFKEAKDRKITSTDIRDKIIESLKNDYPIEADTFKAYKKN